MNAMQKIMAAIFTGTMYLSISATSLVRLVSRNFFWGYGGCVGCPSTRTTSAALSITGLLKENRLKWIMVDLLICVYLLND
jgi:hypothetical protein